MHRVVGGKQGSVSLDDLLHRLSRQKRDLLAQQVLVLRGRGGEIPALPPPDQGEGIAPEIRQASQGHAGVGIPHQGRQAHQVQQKLRIRLRRQPPLDLCLYL